MRRELRSALVAWLVLGSALASACGSDDEKPGPVAEGGDTSEAGASNEGGNEPGSGASAGTTTAGSNPGGAPSGQAGAEAQGAAGVGEGGATGEAGMPSTIGGEAGAGPAEPPDLIESSGGPWPDSASTYCSSANETIVCPQLDEPYFGQDGTYRLNVPTYTLAAATVTDLVTGLLWQRSSDTASKTHAAALSYCDNLDLAGAQDWRLPSRLESVSLLDLGLDSGYALPAGFPVDSTGDHWTASATGTTPDTWFSVNDAEGNWEIKFETTPLLARCVRGTALSGSLQVGAASTVDSMTELEWQTASLDDSAQTWEEALAFCEGLEHASKDDWRLPSIKELATLVDEAGAEAMVIDSASFGTSTAARYWSSTPGQSLTSERFALVLETTFGTSSAVKMSEGSAARCVRTAD